MTDRQLAQLRAALLRLYVEHHDAMSPAEEQAVTRLRDFIYDLQR